MPLYDASNCPHSADLYSVTSGTDAGGGTVNTFSSTPAQAAVPCWAPSLSSSPSDRFAQEQLGVTHEVYFLASAVTVSLARGWKVVVNGAALHVEGINSNQAAGTIPALVKVTGKQIL